MYLGRIWIFPIKSLDGLELEKVSAGTDQRVAERLLRFPGWIKERSEGWFS